PLCAVPQETSPPDEASFDRGPSLVRSTCRERFPGRLSTRMVCSRNMLRESNRPGKQETRYDDRCPESSPRSSAPRYPRGGGGNAERWATAGEVFWPAGRVGLRA